MRSPRWCRGSPRRSAPSALARYSTSPAAEQHIRGDVLMQLHDLTLTELAAGLSAKKFSSREIVDALLARIAKADGKLHAFTEVYAKEAKALADAADTARTSGFPLGPLHDPPMIYKDLCDIEGRTGTGGSNLWGKRCAPEPSSTGERLTAAGHGPLGRPALPRF